MNSNTFNETVNKGYGNGHDKISRPNSINLARGMKTNKTETRPNQIIDKINQHQIIKPTNIEQDFNSIKELNDFIIQCDLFIAHVYPVEKQSALTQQQVKVKWGELVVWYICSWCWCVAPHFNQYFVSIFLLDLLLCAFFLACFDHAVSKMLSSPSNRLTIIAIMKPIQSCQTNKKMLKFNYSIVAVVVVLFQ